MQRSRAWACHRKKANMKRILLWLLPTVALLAATGCKKSTSSTAPAVDIAAGKWIIKGTDGSGPAGTLSFAAVNGKNILSFDCSGSPGPNWPSQAATEYKIENDKLSYINYADASYGFFTADSFKWITPGKEFEIKRRHLLLYMAADYTIRYIRIQ
jgi:hypothetical protein